MNALEPILDRLHPAFIAIDENHCIAYAGELYKYLSETPIKGKPFIELFSVDQPKRYDLQHLIDLQVDNVLIHFMPRNLAIRGTFITHEGSHYFVGAPWFSIESATQTQISPFLAKSHEAWGDLLMATRLLDLQKRDLYRILNDLKKRSEERDIFQAFYSLSPDLMCTLSTDLQFQDTNPRWFSILGWSFEELNQRKVSDFIPDFCVSIFLSKISELVSHTSTHSECECQFLHKSGVFVDLSWAIHIRNNVIYATARDVTIRNQLSRALAERELKLRSIFDSANDAIFTFSKQGDVLSLNQTAASMFNYTEEQLKNLSFFQLFRTSSKTQFYFEGFENIVKSSLGSHVEFEGATYEGHLFPVEISFSQLMLEKDFNVLAIVRDIRERKALERMQSEFISTVTHELRTPLTSITGSLTLLKMLSADQISTDCQKVLDIAQSNSQRLIKLINDLLDIGKIQSGNFSLNTTVFEINSVIHKAIVANLIFANSHNTDLSFSQESSATEVRADEDRLMQIMANLISNAVKFSTESNRVEIRTQRLSQSIRVSVIDYGPGIKPEFYGRIFQRFSQADSSDRRIQGGTGLGLSISKSLIELMGGKIDFTSTPGTGTTFFFELPVYLAPPD